MEIREIKEGGVVVLVPGASVTGNDETRAVEAKIEATIKGGARFLVVDCGAVKQLTSAAVRVLLTASRRLDRIGGRLVLCDMNAQLKKAFSISGVDKDFIVVATREDALQRALEPPDALRPATSDAAPPPGPLVPEEQRVVNPPAALVAGDSVPAEPSPTPLALSSASAVVTHRAALADALLVALDVPAVSVAPAGPEKAEGPDFHTLATGLLAALRVGGSWLPVVSNGEPGSSTGEA